MNRRMHECPYFQQVEWPHALQHLDLNNGKQDGGREACDKGGSNLRERRNEGKPA